MEVVIDMLCWIKHIIRVWYPKLENCASSSTDRGVADNDRDLIQSEFDYFIMTKMAGQNH